MSGEIYGRYKLLEKLAAGGMAQIYLARQQGLVGAPETVVVKRILPHLADNAEFMAMFLDEARIAARLDHPNIVRVFDLGSQDDTLYIAMEHVEGADLRRVWKRAERGGEQIPVPLVCRMIAGAARGLDSAHQALGVDGRPLDIVHRDVSPQNILVSFSGEVKLADFGIAKAADRVRVTRPGVLKGKCSYMSPEQARGEALDRRTDVFALGVVAYELLSGARLFTGATEQEILRAVNECEIAPLSRRAARVPADLERIVTKALARQPRDRYATAGQFSDGLEAWLRKAGAPSSAADLGAFMRRIYELPAAEAVSEPEPEPEPESPRPTIDARPPKQSQPSMREHPRLELAEAPPPLPPPEARPMAEESSVLPALVLVVISALVAGLGVLAWRHNRQPEDSGAYPPPAQRLVVAPPEGPAAMAVTAPKASTPGAPSRSSAPARPAAPARTPVGRPGVAGLEPTPARGSGPLGLESSPAFGPGGSGSAFGASTRDEENDRLLAEIDGAVTRAIQRRPQRVVDIQRRALLLHTKAVHCTGAAERDAVRTLLSRFELDFR